MKKSTGSPLRIGFVPEHFSAPLHFAKKHFGLNADLIPFPSGTGHMITSLRSNEIDVGIGLTEGWVAGLGKEVAGADRGYQFVGTYVETPLRWAISTGASRSINLVSSLQSSRAGISRFGSGSYVMAFVLADQQGWLSAASKEPFDFVPLQTFASLRQAVNECTADFFMWEHFTSKKYVDNGEIKRIGEIYTPWSSWKIVASSALLQSQDERLEDFFEMLDQGIKYFETNNEEAIRYISTELDYSEESVRDWLRTVRFTKTTKGVDVNVITKTACVLRKAGVVVEQGMQATEMIAIRRG